MVTSERKRSAKDRLNRTDLLPQKSFTIRSLEVIQGGFMIWSDEPIPELERKRECVPTFYDRSNRRWLIFFYVVLILCSALLFYGIWVANNFQPF